MRPNGVDLSGEPKVRSDYQKALGDQSIQAQLDRLAKDPRAIESLEDMEKDKQSGRYGKEPRDYWVNAQIGRIFAATSQRAWNEVSRSPAARRLIQQKSLLEQSRRAQQVEKLSNLIVAMMLYKNYATCLNSMPQPNELLCIVNDTLPPKTYTNTTVLTYVIPFPFVNQNDVVVISRNGNVDTILKTSI